MAEKTFIYIIRKHVGLARKTRWKRKEENVITQLRIGHPTGTCTYCNQQETGEHVLLHCNKYKNIKNSPDLRGKNQPADSI